MSYEQDEILFTFEMFKLMGHRLGFSAGIGLTGKTISRYK